ncbi:zinc finger imprinted 3-like [Belonocnema kinseyi]|uniref:zinc finger imprinted 3-like n=1 Tax=Belonocnema kinseyi TaxID=2817044 RepID=UPI00143DEE5B|nr:zinc finger imprinted 3-like [Belonocnema kinseyi]
MSVTGQEYYSHLTTKPECIPKYETISGTTEIYLPNRPEDKTLIIYDDAETSQITEEIIEIGNKYDKTLDIQDEMIQDRETKEVTRRRFNKKYDAKVCSVDLGEYILASNIKHQSQKQQKIKNLEPENKYKCKKCARSYKEKKNLTNHTKYECDVTPQFACNFCGKRFKQKSNMNRHVGLVHLKSNAQISKMKYNCNNCKRSYSSLGTLNRHKREIHVGVKRQFICDYCGHKASQKCYLAVHIYSRHHK